MNKQQEKSKMNDDELLKYALFALQDALEALEEISFNDSDLAQCKAQIQECYDVLESRNEEDEDE